MRGGYDPGRCQKTGLRIERFLGEYVEGRARQMPADEGFHQRIFADQAAPGRVDEERPRGKQRDLAFTDDIARLGIQGQTEEQVLAPFEEALQVCFAADPLQTKAFRQRWLGVAQLQSDEMHPERLEPRRQSLSDAAKTKNPRGPATEAASDRAAPGFSLANVPFQLR